MAHLSRGLPKKIKARTALAVLADFKGSTAADYPWEAYILSRKASTSLVATSTGIPTARWD
jgi:hypothetical protein